jgi:hypothetical protein
MNSVTIRGRSMSAAMQRVAEELGEDALILSSRRDADGAAIVAAPPERAAPGARARAARDDPGAPGPARRRLRLDLADRLGGWPEMAPETRAALRAGAEAGGGLLAGIADALAGPEAHAALDLDRLVLCGPRGAGKARLATRLALPRATRAGGVRVCLLGYEDADATALRLAGAARGLDVRSHRTAADLTAEPPAGACIVAAAAACPVEDIRRVASALDAQPLLALPVGQHPRTLAARVDRWGATAPAVVLTGAAEEAPWPEELAALAARGLPLAAAPDLRAVDRACLDGWARRWLGDTAPEVAADGVTPVFVSRRAAGDHEGPVDRRAGAAPPAGPRAGAPAADSAPRPERGRGAGAAPAARAGDAPVQERHAPAPPPTREPRRKRWRLPAFVRRRRAAAQTLEQPA